MPLDFDDAIKVLNRAKMERFREMRENETLGEYRLCFAEFMALGRHADPIEAHEIRTGCGWDKWSDAEFDSLLDRHPELRDRNPMVMKRLVQRSMGEAFKP